jgi:hypothetical protein
MKILLSLAIIVTSLTAFTIDDAAAQVRKPLLEAVQARTQMRIPAQIRKRDRAVTIIKPADIHTTATISLNKAGTGVKSAGNMKASPAKPGPRTSMMGSIQQAPMGKLKISLSAKNPALQGRAYLNAHYPQSVYRTDDVGFFSFANIVTNEGSLTYSVKLQKDKKYLIEIVAAAWNWGGGHVQHTVGSSTTTHEFGSSNNMINISRVVQPSTDGWVAGSLMQTKDDPAKQWRVFDVKFTEMD